MTKCTMQARAAMNLLDELSGRYGRPEFKRYSELWRTSTLAPLSIYEAAEAAVDPLPENASATLKAVRREAVATECERIALDPQLTAQAVAQYPQNFSTRSRLTGATSRGRE